MWIVFLFNLFISFVFFAISYFMYSSEKYEKSVEKYSAVGLIEKELQEDGSIYYYIKFNDASGNEVSKYSEYYYDTKGKYHVGDSVKVKYFYNKKGNISLLRIVDDDLISCDDKTRIPIYLPFLLFGILFIISAALVFFR